MKKIKKCINKILPITLAGTTLLSTASCTTKPTAKKTVANSYLLNGFESLNDLYNVKPIDVQPTDLMKYNINSNKEYIKDGKGSLEYEELSGNSHGIFQLLKNSPAAKADVRKFKNVSASFFNTASTPKVVSMIACAESGVTLFIEQTTLEPHTWTQANLDLTKYSYDSKSEIAGFEIRFDIEDAAVIYVDNWSVSMGAEDLPKTDLNELINSISIPQNDEKVTEENFDKYVAFVDKVYYAESMYKALNSKEKANISTENVNKLNKCLELVKDIKMVNNSRSNHIDKWYYGHALTVFSKEDSQYGSFWSANVPRTPSEQSFKFDISDTSASGKVVFWIYNPMEVSLKAHFHGGWQLWDFKACELNPKQWNKIEINAIYFERDIKNQIFLVVNGADNIEGEFKFTSFYGISAEIVASTVISAINDLPDISKIDYSYRKPVEKIFEMYNDLSEAAKKAVYNYSKLEDIYKKILSLRLPEMQRILDGLNPQTVVMPRDYTNIFNALSIYDELSDSDKAAVTREQLSKINAFKDIIKDYGLLYGNGIENGIDYVWEGTISQKYDKLYGNYTELNVNKTSGKAQFVDRLVEVDPNEFAQVVFYVYNPLDKDVVSEYSHNWSNNVSLLFKSNEWTEVRINTVDYINSVNFLLFYSDISCSKPWKVTDLYGVKGNIVATSVIKMIDSLPDLDSINMSHFNQIANARLAYDSLPSNVKSYVTNYQKLVMAEKKLALVMIDGLPDADNVEMPRDYTNIAFVKKAYNAMTKQEKSVITKEQLQKLDALFEIIKDYSNIYSNPIESGFDYKWSGDIKRNVDTVYGNITELYVQSTENKMAQFADRLLTVDDKYDKVEFYVYNPLDKDVTTEYSHNWVNPVSINLKSKSWTKISLNASDYMNSVNLFTFYSDISCSEPWKITDYYGVSSALSAKNIDKLIDSIPSDLSISDLEILISLREKYDSLPERVKKLITKYENLVSAEKRMVPVVIDALPSVENIEMPRDCSNSLYAKKIYDSMTDEEKSGITKVKSEKLNAFAAVARNYANIYSETIESGFDYKWSGTAKRSFDITYGNITELFVESTENKMAQFADRLQTVDEQYDRVEFYIYNPMDTDVTTEYSHNWKNPVSINLKNKAWTKVSVDASGFENSINLLTFYSDISCSEPWKITDLYGVKATLYAEEIDKLIDTIPEKLTVEDVELISSIRKKYNDSSERVKKVVTKYDKLVDAEKHLVPVMIDALPSVDEIELPRDYTNIINAKNSYDKLSQSELSSITNAQKDKINALAEKASVCSVLYGEVIESGFDYKWNGEIRQSIDKEYGNITELLVENTELGMAQFADRLLTVDEEYDTVEFYIYNPMNTDVVTEYSHNWENPVGITLKSNEWTKVSVSASGFRDSINLLTFYSDISCSAPWKITDLYGIKTEYYANNMDDLISSIPYNLDIDDIELVSSIRQKYNALSERVKNAVTKYDLLVDAEKKLVSVMIDALPSADEAELPRDYANIINAKNNYDKLSQSELAYIADTQKDKLNALVEKVSVYDVLYSEAIESGFDYKWNGEIKRSVDKVYGNITELLVKDTELGMAQFADRLLTVDSEYMYVEFYIYNPLGNDVSVEYSHNWSKSVAFTLKSEAWTLIRINAIDYSGVLNLMSFYSDISCDKPWKVTDYYGIKSEGLAKILVDKINALPTAENLTLDDKQAVENVQSEFNALPNAVKPLVTNSNVISILVNKLKELEKAQRKSYPIVIDASVANLGTDGSITNNNEDSDFGKVFKISGASYFTLDSTLMTNAYKQCNTVYFYIYNPSSKDSKGYFVSDYDWSFMPTYLLKAKSWNRIEIKDFGAAKGKQFISSGNTIYFYGDFSKTGCKISSFYGINSNTAEDIKGLNKIIDVSTNTLVVDGTILKSNDSVFGDVLAVENSTFLKIGNNLMTSAYKSSKAVVFYIYNPKNTDIDCYFTTDWSFNAYCQLKADSWNRIEITNFGTAPNEKMLSSGKDIYLYGDFADSGWLISSFYELDQKD